MDASFHKLHEAEQKLKQVVISKFDEAVKDEDLASVERFFKIFPLLNMHNEGLQRFTSYLCFKVGGTLLFDFMDYCDLFFIISYAKHVKRT